MNNMVISVSRLMKVILERAIKNFYMDIRSINRELRCISTKASAKCRKAAFDTTFRQAKVSMEVLFCL